MARYTGSRHLDPQPIEHAAWQSPNRCEFAPSVSVGVSRLCAGARTVSGVTFDPALAASPAERLRREIDDTRLVFHKIGLIVEHWQALNIAGETAPGDGPSYQV